MQKHSVSKYRIRCECYDKWELKKKMPFQSKEEPEPWRMSLLTTFVSARINKTYVSLIGKKRKIVVHNFLFVNSNHLLFHYIVIKQC